MPENEQMFEELELRRGNLRVTWEYIGEGLSGDYNHADPQDVPLLRFTVAVYDPAFADELSGQDGYQQLDDASYCTRMPITSPEWMLVKALGILLDAARSPSPKRRFEELSWFCPEDFEKGFQGVTR